MITLTDMFCGCGGSSEGARNVAGTQVQYALNHWKLAIESHNTNHPDTHHDCADISETHPARYQKTTGLIASPECTNHSLAKGQKRKNLHQQEIFQDRAFDASAVRSRATMWDVPRFAEIHKYEFIIVENVVDVRMWVMFDAWLKAMHSLGYKHECVYLNAMFAHDMSGNNFAPQSRDRIYVVFWKKGNRKPDLAIRPKAPCPRCGTVEAIQHWKPGRKAGKYKTQYTYRCSVCATPVVPFYFAALNALDLSLPMVRIGDREKLGMKPLSVNTRNRVQYGLDKFGYVPSILDQANHSGIHPGRVRSALTDTINTQVGRNSSYLFAPYMFNMAFTQSKGDRTYGMDDSFPTQTTQESMAMVAPESFIVANRTNNQPFRLTEPIPTVTGRNAGISFVVPHRKTTPPVPMEGVLPTVTGRPNDMSLIIPIHGTAAPRNAEAEPMDTVMTTGHTSLVSTGFMPIHHGKSKAHHVTDAISTVSSMRTSSLVLLPYHGTMNAHQATSATPTIPTRDSVAMIDAKPEIDDCFFRMLQPKETARAQGFPSDYVILGNKSDQQKQIGNANPPPTMELLVARCVASLL